MRGCLAVFIAVPLFLVSFCFCIVGRDEGAVVGVPLAFAGAAVIAWALGVFDSPAPPDGKPYESAFTPAPGSDRERQRLEAEAASRYPQAPPPPSKIFDQAGAPASAATESPPGPAATDASAPPAPTDAPTPPSKA